MAVDIVIFLVVIHWVADFIFQAEKWAIGKSSSLKSLLNHTCVYSSLWFFPVWIMTGDLYNSILFVAITFIAHTVTDYFTSKVVAKKFANNHYGSPIPNFGAFTMIGFDQVLHYVQLILTWFILFEWL